MPSHRRMRKRMPFLLMCFFVPQMFLFQPTPGRDPQIQRALPSTSTPRKTQPQNQNGLIDNFEFATNEHHKWSLTQIQNALKKDPASPELQVDLARARFLDGDAEQTLAILKEVIAKHPDCGRAYLVRAEFYADGQDWHQALANFQKAEKLGIPAVSVAASFEMARVHRGLKQWKEANADYDRVINSGLLAKPLRGKVEFHQADLATTLHSGDLGFAEYTAVIKDDPLITGAYVRRGQIYAQQNKIKQAIQEYTSAIEIERDHPTKIISTSICNWYRGRAKLYTQIGRKDLADRDLSSAKQYDQDSMQATPFR